MRFLPPMAQTALEAALQEFPASLERSERWRAVARRVGRPLNECVSRYQELRQVQLFPLLLSFCCFSFCCCCAPKGVHAKPTAVAPAPASAPASAFAFASAAALAGIVLIPPCLVQAVKEQLGEAQRVLKAQNAREAKVLLSRSKGLQLRADMCDLIRRSLVQLALFWAPGGQSINAPYGCGRSRPSRSAFMLRILCHLPSLLEWKKAQDHR
jgi:hypothetical protein